MRSARSPVPPTSPITVGSGLCMAGLGGAFAEGLEARVVGDGAHRNAQPGVHARLDAFERLELLGQLERAVGGLLAAALDDGIVDRAQGTLELSAQSADAGVDAARGGGVAEYALAVALLRGVRDRSEQAVDLGRVHDRRALR